MFGFADKSKNKSGQKMDHCFVHRLPGQKNVKRIKCAVDGCDTTAWYRNPGEKVSRCGPHKLAGMVQTSVVTCKAAGCTTMVTKKISVFCQAHKPTEVSSDDSDVSEYSDDGSVAGQNVVSTRVTRSTESSLPTAAISYRPVGYGKGKRSVCTENDKRGDSGDNSGDSWCSLQESTGAAVPPAPSTASTESSGKAAPVPALLAVAEPAAAPTTANLKEEPTLFAENVSPTYSNKTNVGNDNLISEN